MFLAQYYERLVTPLGNIDATVYSTWDLMKEMVSEYCVSVCVWVCVYVCVYVCECICVHFFLFWVFLSSLIDIASCFLLIFIFTLFIYFLSYLNHYFIFIIFYYFSPLWRTRTAWCWGGKSFILWLIQDCYLGLFVARSYIVISFCFL